MSEIRRGIVKGNELRGGLEGGKAIPDKWRRPGSSAQLARELLCARDRERGGDVRGPEVAIGLGAAEGKLVFACSYRAGSFAVDLGEGAGIETEGDVLCLSGRYVRALESGE